MEIKVLHLYYDLLNLYGEYGNINILISHLKDQGVNVLLDKKTINDSFNLNDYDFVYCGSGTENHIMLALEDFKKHKDELNNYINENKYALYTGSSLELLVSKIVLPNDEIDALNVFHIKAVRLKDRKTQDVVLKTDLFDKEIVGFVNKQSEIEENKEIIFKNNNLLATYVIGPILVRNPHVLKYFVEGIIKQKDKNYEFKDIKYTNEEEGYDLVLNELKNRK